MLMAKAVSTPAIAFDNSGHASGGSAGSITWSHTTAGTNRVLFVGVWIYPTSITITGVTYGGVACSFIDSVVVGSASQYIALYSLANPALGANNVVVSVSSSSGSVYAGSLSYNGARQTGIPDAYAATSYGYQTSISESVTTVANHCWALGIYRNSNGDSSETLNANAIRLTDSLTGAIVMGDTNGPVAAGATVTMVGSNDSSGFGGIIIASFAP